MPIPAGMQVVKLEPPVSRVPPSINTSPNARSHPAHQSAPTAHIGNYDYNPVIKSGPVQKRKKKTKSWRTVYLVLRPNILSIYSDVKETKLRHRVVCPDLTAVARQRDPKGKVENVFALFQPSRNFHFAAPNDIEAQQWVERIRHESRIDEVEEEMRLASPSGAKSTYAGFERRGPSATHGEQAQANNGDSSSEADPTTHTTDGTDAHNPFIHTGRRPSATLDYSGPEHASYSDFSDAGVAARTAALSLSRNEPRVKRVDWAERQERQETTVQGSFPASDPAQDPTMDETQAYVAELQRRQQVVRQGWLYLLRSKSGMRQWKRLWMVLRPISLAMYKDERQYEAYKVIQFSSIIDAVEIDAISNTKRYCMQIITEDKNYRLCARDADTWANWLGSYKSLLLKRKERERQLAGHANE